MSLLLICLIVTDTCNPSGLPFLIRITGDELGGDLAKAVKSKAPNKLRNIAAFYLRLWKPIQFFPSSPRRELANHVQGLHLNGPESECKAVELDYTAPLHEFYPSDTPLPFGVVHVVVQLPPVQQVPNPGRPLLSFGQDNVKMNNVQELNPYILQSTVSSFSS
ncbi:hypothetical protein B0F90DRAFT_1818872 [Multifurca ochricompacta]|uniref:Crinkler effector protein N-terminal domain-containing protein n=1 Tax=Multifurca ochricompacta TaxID=376703 RepID=A0AAD4M0Q2_9AGAM|nr:hypothetical protein B0F90DRAFT_1818872 [Multifurca ochricompacta]